MTPIETKPASNTMKCLHCKQGILAQGLTFDLGKYPCPTLKPEQYKPYTLKFLLCPLCGEAIISLFVVIYNAITGKQSYFDTLLYPKRAKYDLAPKEVPPQYAKDFNEAVNTLAISPNASSAMSRRCLQSILRHECKIKGKGNLDKQIELYLKTNPPLYIKDTLHRVRKVGAIAVHPFTHKTTGEIIDATPEIAEYTIVALQKMFDLLFVEPARTKAQEAEIDKLYNEKSK